MNDRSVILGGIYQHYKGALYVVLFVGQDSNNDRNKENTVIYMSLTEPHAGAIRVRHVAEFLGEVESNDQRVPRFTLIGMTGANRPYVESE